MSVLLNKVGNVFLGSSLDNVTINFEFIPSTINGFPFSKAFNVDFTTCSGSLNLPFVALDFPALSKKLVFVAPGHIATKLT